MRSFRESKRLGVKPTDITPYWCPSRGNVPGSTSTVYGCPSTFPSPSTHPRDGSRRGSVRGVEHSTSSVRRGRVSAGAGGGWGGGGGRPTNVRATSTTLPLSYTARIRCALTRRVPSSVLLVSSAVPDGAAAAECRGRTERPTGRRGQDGTSDVGANEPRTRHDPEDPPPRDTGDGRSTATGDGLGRLDVGHTGTFTPPQRSPLSRRRRRWRRQRWTLGKQGDGGERPQGGHPTKDPQRLPNPPEWEGPE